MPESETAKKITKAIKTVDKLIADGMKTLRELRELGEELKRGKNEEKR